MRAEFVPPDTLEAAPGWLPSYFLGASAVALRAARKGQTLGTMGAQILEGWRASETPNTVDYDPRASSTPVYRQANIRPLRLQLSPGHWASPHIEGHWCVRPGDLVVNKLAPVRAAFISPAAKRHPVDGNTLIVRELARADAAWVALCLNHPAYERLLLTEAGLLQRVGLKALAALRVPPVPPAMESLSARLHDALDTQMLTGEALHRVRCEADALTRAAQTTTRPLGRGACFARDAINHDSWLPSATALRAEQSTLAAEYGWAALGDLASSDERERLTHAPEGARSLRLGDVGDDLFVAPGDDASAALVLGRALAKPLVPGEVLLSTLGRSFRTAYVDDEVPRYTFPSDGWARLRFRETPAAWALLLSTEALCAQASRLTVGSVQQFVPPNALWSLRVPVPTREVRDRWQRAVERHHAQRRQQDHAWSALVAALSATFDAVHQPFTLTPSRAKKVLQ